METGRELDNAMRELEGKLAQLRRLMADSTVPFAVYAEAEAWAKSLLQSVHLTDSLASELRRVLLGESLEKSAGPNEPAFFSVQTAPPTALTEMEVELERVFGSEVAETDEVPETNEEITATERKVDEVIVGLLGHLPEAQDLDVVKDLLQRLKDLQTRAELYGQTPSEEERIQQWTVEALDALKKLERDRTDFPPDRDSDEPIGGAPVGAVPKPKPPSHAPENARTFEEAMALPRNP
jgi:hypothetical protein